jgi:Tol biopolymer transport system component
MDSLDRKKLMKRSLKRKWISGLVLLVLTGAVLSACAAGPYAGAIAYQRVVDETSQIYVMDPQGEVKTLISEGTGWFFMPSWSWDGERVAYYYFNPGTQMTTVYAVDVTQPEMEPVLLTDSGTYDLEFGVLKWSPNGESILFYTLDVLEIADIYKIDTETGVVKDLFEQTVFDDLAPDWSPDGEQFVFASNRPDKDDPIYNLYLSDADGQNLIQLTDNNEFGWVDTLPAWSPGGTKIAFFRYNYIPGKDFEGGPQGLWWFDVDTAEENLLYEMPVATEDLPPVWSPDGKYLAFLEPLDGKHILRVLDAKSGELLGINEVLGEKRTVSWSPDSRALAFTNLSEGEVGLFILDLRSGELTEIMESDPGVLIGDPHWGGN